MALKKLVTYNSSGVICDHMVCIIVLTSFATRSQELFDFAPKIERSSFITGVISLCYHLSRIVKATGRRYADN